MLGGQYMRLKFGKVAWLLKLKCYFWAFISIFQENILMLIEEDQKNYQHASSTIHITIKCTMWGTFIFKIHATSPKSSLIYRGGGTDFGLGGQKIFYRGQKKFFCTNIFPQEGFPSNIGWAAAHPAHPGPTPLFMKVCMYIVPINCFALLGVISYNFDK